MAFSLDKKIETIQFDTSHNLESFWVVSGFDELSFKSMNEMTFDQLSSSICMTDLLGKTVSIIFFGSFQRQQLLLEIVKYICRFVRPASNICVCVCVCLCVYVGVCGCMRGRKRERSTVFPRYSWGLYVPARNINPRIPKLLF